MAVLRTKTNLSVGKRIICGLGEYFFGTKTKDAFTYERAFYKEFFKNLGIFKRYSKESFIQKSNFILFYKHIPNVIEGACLTVSFLEKEYGPAALGFFCGELLRAAGAFRNPVKENRKFLEYNINSLKNGKSLEEYALEKT